MRDLGLAVAAAAVARLPRLRGAPPAEAETPPGGLHLEPGLNLLSWPGEAPVLLSHLARDYPAVDRAFRFDNERGAFESFAAGAPAVANTLKALLPGLPYWLSARTAVDIGAPAPPAEPAEPPEPADSAPAYLPGAPISTLVAPFEQSVEQLVAGDGEGAIEALFAWDAATQSWRAWVRGAPQIANTLRRVEAGQALFARVRRPLALTIARDGQALPPPALPPGPLRVLSHTPTEESPLEEKVVLRGDEELFRASASLTGAAARCAGGGSSTAPARSTPPARLHPRCPSPPAATTPPAPSSPTPLSARRPCGCRGW